MASASPSPRLQWALHGLVAVVGVAPALLHPGHTVGDGVDAFGTHWFYWWIRQCVEHGGDPSFTDLFFFPDGKAIFAHTGNNFVDAVLSVPLQWLFGPTLYQPLFVVLLQLGNVVAMRALARGLFEEEGAAFAAGLLWQCNPWLLFEFTAGRPTQGMAWFLPVALLYAWRLARGEGGWRVVAGFGAAMALAGWTYWFYLFFLVFTLLALAPAWFGRDRARWGRVAAAAGVCTALVLPALIGMARATGAGEVPGIGDGADGPRALANNVAKELHGLWLMETQGAPLFGSPAWGVPLLLALSWRGVAVPGGRRAWGAALAVLIVLALGAGVPLREDLVLPNPVYLALYRWLPFFDRLWFPYRFASVAFVVATVLIVAWWRHLGGRAWLLGVLVLGSLGAQGLHGDWPLRHRDARAPGLLRDTVATAPGHLVFLPMGIQHDGLMWQTELGRPTFGGMGESAPIFWPPGYAARLKRPFARALGAAARGHTPTRVFAPADRGELTDLGFRWVILRLDLVRETRGGGEEAAAAAAGAVRALLGEPPVAADGQLQIWKL